MEGEYEMLLADAKHRAHFMGKKTWLFFETLSSEHHRSQNRMQQQQPKGEKKETERQNAQRAYASHWCTWGELCCATGEQVGCPA